jgi:hypothetical protein
MADDEKKAKGTVQGCIRIAGSGASYWFWWWIWPQEGGRSSYGPAYLSDQQAWQWEFAQRSQNLGVQLQRWAWTGSRWILDERPDPEFLAAAPIPGYSVGAIPVSPPLRGKWTAKGFPETVNLGSRVFKRAGWQRPIQGVVMQYRETSPTNSRHLFVLGDGTFVVDHVDEFNPDGPGGDPLAHFMADVVLRPIVRA